MIEMILFGRCGSPARWKVLYMLNLLITLGLCYDIIIGDSTTICIHAGYTYMLETCRHSIVSDQL